MIEEFCEVHDNFEKLIGFIVDMFLILAFTAGAFIMFVLSPLLLLIAFIVDLFSGRTGV